MMAGALTASAEADLSDPWERWTLYSRAAEGFNRARVLYLQASRMPTFNEIDQKRTEWTHQAREATEAANQAARERDYLGDEIKDAINEAREWSAD